MAQISLRCQDEEKDRAELALKHAGYNSLPEYLGTIVTYMSEHGTLPVVIKFKPIALSPDDAFQQAIIRFRDVHLSVSNLLHHVLKAGEMTPLEGLRVPIDDIQAAQAFYEQNEELIAMAPGQLEKMSTEHNFARCREHFPYVPGFLRTAIRMVNMNNRPVSEQDLQKMREALGEAARHINILQSMAGDDASQESGRLFFLVDAAEARACARLAVAPEEAWMVRHAWGKRMAVYIRQAENQYVRLGILPDLDKLAAIVTLLHQCAAIVEQCLATETSVLTAGDEMLLEQLEADLRALRNTVAPTVIQTT